MRQRQPKELQRFMIDDTSIQDHKDIFVCPPLQCFGDEWPVEGWHVDELILQPAAHLGDASGGLSLTRNMLRDLTQMHGLRQNQADDTQTQLLIRFRCGSGCAARNLVKTRVYNSVLMLMKLAFQVGVVINFDCSRFMGKNCPSVSQDDVAQSGFNNSATA